MTRTSVARSAHPIAHFVVSVSDEGSTTVVAIRGEVDCATLPTLVDMLDRVLANGVGPVVVDLAETTFIDSATTRALGQFGRRLGEADRHLTLRSPSRIAERVLGLLGLSHLVERGPPLTDDCVRPAARAGRLARAVSHPVGHHGDEAPGLTGAVGPTG